MILKKINLISKKFNRKKIIIIILLSIITTLLELVGIGSLIPLLTTLSGDTVFFKNFSFLFIQLSTNEDNIILFFLILIILIFLLKNIFVFFVNLFQAKYLFSFYNFLMKSFLDIYLKQPYSFHLNRNSAVLMRNIRKETSGFINGLKNLLIIINESLVLTALLILLFFFNYEVTITLIILVSFVGFIFNQFVSKKSYTYGKLHQFHDGKLNQTLHEGFGSLKDIYLYNRSDNFVMRYLNHSNVSKKVNIYASMIGSIPRHWLEIIFILSLISIVIYSHLILKDVGAALPLAGLYAVSGIRIMPAINKIISSYQQINLSKASIDLVFDELKLKNNIYKDSIPISETNNDFKQLKVKNLSFKYEGTEKYIIKNINLIINCNSIIGFVGASGSGKTTLIDCILGLLPPSEGHIYFNDINIKNNLKSWQKKIGYVPQNIYLMDATIRENIAIGIDDELIDKDKINNSIKLANLTAFIDQLPNKLDTIVGEKGVRISGGQKQRIGIARALYNNPSILVLDEATNSLDSETEEKFLNFIRELKTKKNLTILMITHRINTLKICDKVFQIQNNKLISYNEK